MAAYKFFVGVAESVMPVLSSSQFLEKGVLTPEEFVAAGDLLVHHCPTWSWETGDVKKLKTYLPKDKQFLITRNVPSLMRATSQQFLATDEQDEEDGWTSTHHNLATPQEVSDIPDKEGAAGGGGDPLNLASLSKATAEVAGGGGGGGGGDDDDDDIPDMDGFEDENLVESDPAALSSSCVVRQDSDDNVLKTRTYDLSITYDKYHQTPRVWLFGYDENRQPLASEQVFEDMSSEHAHKTVTIENHPHYSIPHASIHPCRHAQTMKNMLERIKAAGKEPRVDQYLLVFLKFISTAIPTIQYDYTVEMQI